ncbi:hypothetical protein EW146_g5362 [Bondarzewia mesenterica]|uniref:Uncharacterized protein n=1 Tax=Bondarzewia mesenterica TaxID=1095465 RepID=A0A4S4LTS9_9AGAM|nr:hypothetical protein EW146_g5362 [Bondarzewia mesenterica]
MGLTGNGHVDKLDAQRFNLSRLRGSDNPPTSSRPLPRISIPISSPASTCDESPVNTAESPVRRAVRRPLDFIHSIVPAKAVAHLSQASCPTKTRSPPSPMGKQIPFIPRDVPEKYASGIEASKATTSSAEGTKKHAKVRSRNNRHRSNDFQPTLSSESPSHDQRDKVLRASSSSTNSAPPRSDNPRRRTRSLTPSHARHTANTSNDPPSCSRTRKISLVLAGVRRPGVVVPLVPVPPLPDIAAAPLRLSNSCFPSLGRSNAPSTFFANPNSSSLTHFNPSELPRWFRPDRDPTEAAGPLEIKVTQKIEVFRDQRRK